MRLGLLSSMNLTIPLEWIVIGGIAGAVLAVTLSVARSFGLFLLHGKDFG